MMPAHHYREKITVMRDFGSVDSDGVIDAQWGNHLINVPCAVQWKTGQSQVVRDRITSRRFAVIRCAILDILVTDRIVYNSELYNITSVVNRSSRFLEIEMDRNTEEEPDVG